jgi:predicted dienelactone hydrolase
MNWGIISHGSVHVWERPKDVSAILDEIMYNPQNYQFIDTNRVAMLGFSVGGYTAMTISGARVDPGIVSTSHHKALHKLIRQ